MSQKSNPNEGLFDEGAHLSILEAVENLSNIADMDVDDKLGLIEDHVVVQGATEEDVLETIQWLEDKSEHQTEQVVEETYKAVLKYVKDFHRKEFSRFYEDKNQAGIKKIMLLVGKATDKLKNYTHLFKGIHKEGAEETKEYRQLNKFYNERIAIEEDDKVSLIDLSRKDREMEAQKHPEIEEDENLIKSKQFILDIEKTKEDKDYELLYLQRDDGTRFMEPDYYRNVKVACNFTDFVGKKAERDPIEGLDHWQDLSLHKSAVGILKIIRPYLKEFYSESLKYKDMEVVSTLSMGIMALMLAANPQNRSHLNPAKSCKYCFYDFQHYLRETFTSFEYQKLRSFPPPSSSIFLNTMMDIIHMLSWALFFQTADLDSLSFVVDDMLEEGKVSVRKSASKSKKPVNFWDGLEDDYLHIQRYLMNYPVGPVFKTLEILQEGQGDAFDPCQMGNTTLEFQALEIDGTPLSLLRLPSPTNQELISKVRLDQEFAGLIDALAGSHDPKSHLIVNLQDRTQWNEFARSDFLEKLPKDPKFVKTLETVTLTKSSDFYHQTGAYQELSRTKDFLKQLVFHLHSKETGFYFAPWLEEKIFSGFIEKVIGQIHRFFFNGKSTLKQEERQDFIEILYQLLNLKFVELSEASSMSFTCKDALDTGAIQTLTFFSFLKLISGQEMGARERQKIHLLLFAYPVLIRNRPTQAEGFLRMLQCLKRVESALAKHSKGQFHKTFNSLFEFDTSQIDFVKSTFDRVRKDEDE